MKKFEIEFEVIERSVYSASVEAETPEEALKLFHEKASDYDSDQGDMLSNDNDMDTVECTGEWIEDKPGSGYATLNRFPEPIKLAV